MLKLPGAMESSLIVTTPKNLTTNLAKKEDKAIKADTNKKKRRGTAIHNIHIDV